MKKKCHSLKLQKHTFFLDTNIDRRFNSKYYINLVVKMDVLVLDQVLFIDALMHLLIQKNQNQVAFFVAFTKVMVKIDNIKVFQSNRGNIYKNYKIMNK